MRTARALGESKRGRQGGGGPSARAQCSLSFYSMYITTLCAASARVGS
jgi:hypothetical protein